jgi:hypothetical protein
MADRLSTVDLPDVEWLTQGALSKLIGVNYETIHAGVDRGELPEPHRRISLLPRHMHELIGTVNGPVPLYRNISITVFSVAELREAATAKKPAPKGTGSRTR